MIGPSAQPVSFRRRQLLQAGCLAGLSWLAGCARSDGSPLLRAPTKSLPALWQKQLKAPWRITELKAINSSAPPWLSSTDLLTIGDGWLSRLNAESFQAIDAAPLQSRLGAAAERFLSELPKGWKGKIFPVSVSPWVMLFRGEPSLKNQTANSWDVLLDPEFAGKVLLPSSPRLVMSLAEHMQTTNALRRLKEAAISFDDRHALNWLLQGDAQVAVLPLQRCMGALLRDQRLHAVLPAQGAPLNWTLMLRPSSSKEPLPQEWVKKSWEEPLLSRLLSAGWVPPLTRSQLSTAMSRVPKRLRALVLPSNEIWQRCWNLAPLDDPSEQDDLKDKWKVLSP
jgi:putative spermidine/putrescine transport system substrate-binding protein